jgi:iron complex outermembrane receptor protein
MKMTSRLSRYLLATAALASLCAAAPAQAQAQAQAQAAAAGAAAEPTLAEITVTARRREETLQHTPVSVTAISADTLQAINFNRMDNVARVVPNLNLTANIGYLGGAATYIRGIGSGETVLSVDQPIAQYQDGVYLAHGSSLGNFELQDPARVEVLRGPQGTLFGRNTTGGLINVVTRKPADNFGVRASAGYAGFSEWYSKAFVDTGEIAGTGLYATVGLFHRQRHGYVDNPNQPSSVDPGALDSNGASIKLHGDWGRFEFDYAGDYVRSAGASPAFQVRFLYSNVAGYYARSPSLGGQPLVIDPNNRLDTISLLRQKPMAQEVQGHAVTLTYNLTDDVTVKSITAWRRYTARSGSSYSGLGILGPCATGVCSAFLYYADGKAVALTTEQQEFQVLGGHDNFNWQAGVFWYHEKGRDNNPSFFTFVNNSRPAAPLTAPAGTLGTFSSSSQRYVIKGEAIAAYGQASWKPEMFDAKLELTGGLRWTQDQKHVDQSLPGVRTGDAKFHNTSFLASANYQWTDQVMTYVRYGTGYRSGGFNVRASFATAGVTNPFLFQPEKAKSVEGGVKSRFLDNRVQVNLGVFHTDIDNLQVNQFVGGNATTGGTVNASARYDGAELEITALPVRHLQVTANVGFVDPEYKHFPLQTTGGAVVDVGSSGHFQYVSRWTTNLALQYTADPTSFGTPSARVDWAWNSDRYFHVSELQNPYNDAISDPGHGTLNARITLADIPLKGSNATWELSVWGDNLTNEDYIVAGIEFGPSLGFAGNIYGMPRRVGVDARLKF